jgi:aldehyde dehydrogenase (NAD+)
MKVPAALAAANTVVIKPPEVAPFGSEVFTDLLRRAGFPPGVVNVVPGDAATGRPLVEHPLVKKVTFTGGTATGQRIL